MTTRKKTSNDDIETGLAILDDITSLMAPAERSQFSSDEAGRGVENIDSQDIILPRVVLLQPLSKACQDELPGAKPGGYWLTPFNRPVTSSQKDSLKFVVVRMYPSQRHWIPLDQGGGLSCEASTGDLVASSMGGLAGAKLSVTKIGDTVKAVEWTGGRHTDRCFECVYGPAASAAAAGKAPVGRGNPWLPKIVDIDGERLRIPDELRAPSCTSSLDALVLIAVPPFSDIDSGINLGPEVIPAFISFSKTSQPAGKSLAGMIKMSVREPSYAKIYGLGSAKTTNDKGTFFVATVQQVGFSSETLLGMARELYSASAQKAYRPDMTEESAPTLAAGSTAQAIPPSDDDPEPEDEF